MIILPQGNCHKGRLCRISTLAEANMSNASPSHSLNPKRCKIRRFLSSILWTIAVASYIWSGAVSASYLEVQNRGLEALYNATGGDEWTSSTGWLDAAFGVCSWHGVTCDSSGQNVTALSLSGNALTGSIDEAAELFDLVSLASIDLSSNQLFGPVALGFGLMPGLEVLDLSRNELSSFPATWGAEAWSLQHLFLQFNNISGTLPSAWLDTHSNTSGLLVHSTEVSSWLPELRTLSLRGNAISMPVYHALQSVIGLKSLQVLDLSSNALSGDMEQAFELYYCEAGDLDACASPASKTGASILAILLLASNFIEGGLETNSLPRSLSVLTVSNNLLSGPLPDDFSQLSVFLADGNEGLNDTALPSFAVYANSSVTITKHLNLSCPVISGERVDGVGGGVRLTLDPSYLGYSHCVCAEGMEGNFQDGCQPCPEGTYRGHAELFDTRSCTPCPANTWSMTVGAESVSQCKCNPGFYDVLEGSGGTADRGPSCFACAHGSVGRGVAGAISVVTACSCSPGHYLDEATGVCGKCKAGTYKASVGNDAGLCVPCAKGTFSSQLGGTSSDFCVPCEPGTYSASSGATASSTCLPCPAGTYSAMPGLSDAALCMTCPPGYYSGEEGATDSAVCTPCRRGRYSSEKGASSSDACEPCPDGYSSLTGSHRCETLLANSRRWLVIYLTVGASTLAAICGVYYTYQKKVHKHKKLKVDSRATTPLKMSEAKRKAHVWAFFFHTLETIDVITGNALFAYLLDIGAIQGFTRVIYWLAVSMGVALNVYRVYMIIWMKFLLVNVSVVDKPDKDRKKLLLVHMPPHMPWDYFLPDRPRPDRRIMTPDDAKMVLELIKILKHLQINKFKVQLAVIMDLPLTILNLWLLWMVEPELIKSALFLTSLMIAVFSAGKISTLIEYHLELRQRKRKLERLLLLELKSSNHPILSQDGEANDDDELAGSQHSDNEEEDECYEHGQPETLLEFHGKSMRNIATTEAENPPPITRRRNRLRYLKLSPMRRSPKDRGGVTRKRLSPAGGGGNGNNEAVGPTGVRGSPRRLIKAIMSQTRNNGPAAYATLP